MNTIILNIKNIYFFLYFLWSSDGQNFNGLSYFENNLLFEASNNRVNYSYG